MLPLSILQMWQMKDTLILHELPPWKRSIKRKPLSSSKYYFFDTGVATTLQGRRHIQKGTSEFGDAFETYIYHELMSYRDYISGEPLTYWRSTSGFEVDFIIDDHTAVEVKAKENVSVQDLKSLRALAEEKKLKRYLCVSLEARTRKLEGITVLPVKDFLKSLWEGEYA